MTPSYYKSSTISNKNPNILITLYRIVHIPFDVNINETECDLYYLYNSSMLSYNDIYTIAKDTALENIHHKYVNITKDYSKVYTTYMLHISSDNFIFPLFDCIIINKFFYKLIARFMFKRYGVDRYTSAFDIGRYTGAIVLSF